MIISLSRWYKWIQKYKIVCVIIYTLLYRMRFAICRVMRERERKSASVILFWIDFCDLSSRSRRDEISADKLARDNVAGRTENVKSPFSREARFARRKSRQRSRRLFDAFYNALKVTINYRGAHDRMCSAEARACVHPSTYVCVIRAYVCVCRVHINLEHTAVAMPATSEE